MVPGPRARESRSPLDSRGPLPRRQGASSFLRATARAGVLPGLRRGARSRRHGMSVHAACGSRPLSETLEGPFLLSNQFSMLFVFLCSHTDRAGNRAVMRTCNICTLNIPTWHIDKKSIKISKIYTPRPRSNCSLEL